ncbi:MAG: CHASE2 domain-containing protein, partial [Treponema sp.]|nr:CHASE2 domain-containing protein [Treponema sp.]
MKRYKKGITVLVIVLCVFAGTGLLRLAGAFDYFEYKAYDLRVNFFANSSRPSDDIIVVLLDQQSIDWANAERGWPWPWPRKAYAELVDYMNLGGAASVAFDVLFSEPSIYRSADQDRIIDTAIEKMEEIRANFTAMAEARQEQAPRRTRPAEQGSAGGFGVEGYREAMEALRGLSAYADDGSFIEASKNYRRVVQAVFFSSQSGSAESWPAALDKPVFSLDNFDAILSGFSISEDWVGAQFPIQGLSEAAGAIGNVTSAIDS